MTSRRDFIKNLSISGAIFLSGKPVSAAEFFNSRKKVKLRFIVASDGHYGQPKTDFDAFHETLVKNINRFCKEQTVDFCVINGDLFHDEPSLLTRVKEKIDKIEIPYFVTKGNHDKVSEARWEEVWKMPTNHTFEIKNNAIILGNTATEKGEYVSPNLHFMNESLEKSQAQKNTFIFLHIPQIPWVEHCIDSPDLIKMFANYKNIKAVFHGHIHTLDDIKIHQGIPYIFDAHFGGSWGTEYKGFRVVEVMKDNAILTYMMNPTERILEARI